MADVASKRVIAVTDIRFMALTSQRMQMEWRLVRKLTTAQMGFWLMHLPGTGACGLAPKDQPEDSG